MLRVDNVQAPDGLMGCVVKVGIATTSVQRRGLVDLDTSFHCPEHPPLVVNAFASEPTLVMIIYERGYPLWEPGVLRSRYFDFAIVP